MSQKLQRFEVGFSIKWYEYPEKDNIEFTVIDIDRINNIMTIQETSSYERRVTIQTKANGRTNEHPTTRSKPSSK